MLSIVAVAVCDVDVCNVQSVKRYVLSGTNKPESLNTVHFNLLQTHPALTVALNSFSVLVPVNAFAEMCCANKLI